jgi:BirA family biotin operon repressor/biotin-[acetyl-CoA-carboxylase] ligase
MDEASTLSQKGEAEGTVVFAEEQTLGRGRLHRPWLSRRAQNLEFSVLLRPKVVQLPHVNMAATMAVCRAVQKLYNLSPSIKWPNDVRINGRKLSGILMETTVQSSELTCTVVGIGLNVNFAPSRLPGTVSSATSLSMEIGQRIDRTNLLSTLLEELDDLYRVVGTGHSLTSDWSAMLETLGRTVRVRWKDQVIEGHAQSIDDQGNLILIRPDETIFTALAGEVTLQI